MVVGAGFGGIAAGVKLKQAGIRHVHDLRIVARDRRHVVGQHLPRRRSRCGLAPVLLLVQAPRLDAHARPAARAAALPRADRRRVRPSSAPATRCRRRVRHVGRRAPRLDGPARRRDRRRVPRARERSRLPQRAALSRLAGAPGLRGAGVPHRALGAPARPGRQGRGRGRHRIVGDAGRAGDPADRQRALRVPARAGLGHAQGRARPQRRGAGGLRPSLAAHVGALAAAST